MEPRGPVATAGGVLDLLLRRQPDDVARARLPESGGTLDHERTGLLPLPPQHRDRGVGVDLILERVDARHGHESLN